MCPLMLAKLLLFTLLSPIHVYCHPAPSLVLCHGLQTNVKYYYDYRTSMFLNNDDHNGKEPVSFGYSGKFIVENVWQDERNYLIRVNFLNGDSGNYIDRKGQPVRGPGYGSPGPLKAPLYVHIVDNNDTQQYKSFYRNHKESITVSNLKKAIASLLRTKRSSEKDEIRWYKKGQDLEYSHSSTWKTAPPQPLMLPLVIDEWTIRSKVGRDHTYIIESNGWQNVTLLSKVYNNAYSKLYLQYSLKLDRDEVTSPDPLSRIKDLNQVISSLGADYIQDELPFHPEHKTCLNCKTLQSLEQEYEEHMSQKEMASVPAAIAYLKLLDRVRSGGPGTSTEDILLLLKGRKDHPDVLSSLIDILAGARSEQAINAALQHLNLPHNLDLDISERFLATLSVSALTAVQSSTESFLSSLEFIVKELMNAVQIEEWQSYKLKLSTFVSLGTILRAHNLLSNNREILINQMNLDFVNLIKKELNSCDDPDCTSSLLVALGNSANLKLSFKILEPYAVNVKGKRESVFALRAIQDGFNFLQEKCNQLEPIESASSFSQDKDLSHCVSKMLGKSLFHNLKNVIAQIIWEEKHESTSRIIATEIVSMHLKDDTLVNSLLKDVENFENFEMTTLMWNRALRERRSAENTHKNWLIHSKLFNGSSASFKKHLASTPTMNASYGITMELLTKGKLLKESSFDFEMHGDGTKPLHILTVGLLARGLGSITGDDSESDEATSAGLALKVLDSRLRPYTLFSGKGDLMGHVWSGTASDPLTAFSGNLLVSDYDGPGHRLINGFALEQQLRGIISLELTGKITISLWGRNSHSVVQGKVSLLMQGSQSIRTSDLTTTISQKFAFGGSTAVDLVTDADFYRMPFKHCLQMEQPELTIRHNTRKYEQVDSCKTDARIHRRTYFIPAKSFAFHSDNNKMCAIMKS